jgi:Fe-S-cluster containining protein
MPGAPGLTKKNFPPGDEPFYSGGLRFSCTRCSSCCRHESGFVFLSQKDVKLLAAERKMKYTDFVETYCRWIPAGPGEERLSLKEKSNYDCIFWKEGCSVYAARPLQCRAFPFWPSIICFSGSWDMAKTGCPGMGRGAMVGRDAIESWLEQQKAEPALVRYIQKAGRV